VLSILQKHDFLKPNNSWHVDEREKRRKEKVKTVNRKEKKKIKDKKSNRKNVREKLSLYKLHLMKKEGLQ